MNAAKIEIAQPLPSSSAPLPAGTFALPSFARRDLTGFASLFSGILNQTGTTPQEETTDAAIATGAFPEASTSKNQAPKAFQTKKDPTPPPVSNTPSLSTTLSNIASVLSTNPLPPAIVSFHPENQTANAAAQSTTAVVPNASSNASNTGPTQAVVTNASSTPVGDIAFALQLTWQPARPDARNVPASDWQAEATSNANPQTAQLVERQDADLAKPTVDTSKTHGGLEPSTSSLTNLRAGSEVSTEHDVLAPNPEGLSSREEQAKANQDNIERATPAGNAPLVSNLAPESQSRNAKADSKALSTDLAVNQNDQTGSPFDIPAASTGSAILNETDPRTHANMVQTAARNTALPRSSNDDQHASPTTPTQTAEASATSRVPVQEQNPTGQTTTPAQRTVSGTNPAAVRDARSQDTSGNSAGRDSQGSESDPKGPKLQTPDKAATSQLNHEHTGASPDGLIVPASSAPDSAKLTSKPVASDPTQPAGSSHSIEPASSSIQTHPVREISLRLGSPDSAKVDVQLAQRAGKVQVAVHTSDQDLAKSLQTNLGELVGRLEEKGFKTEAWTPWRGPTRGYLRPRAVELNQQPESIG